MRDLNRSLALAALTMLAGCGNRATLTVTDGRTVEAQLVGSDAESIRYADPEGALARAEVVDIDHPGDGLMWAGGLFALACLPDAAGTGSGFLGETKKGVATGGLLLASGVFAIGAYRYFGSVNAADAVTFGLGPGSAVVSGRF